MKYSNKFLDGKELHTKQWSSLQTEFGRNAYTENAIVGNKQQQQSSVRGSYKKINKTMQNNKTQMYFYLQLEKSYENMLVHLHIIWWKSIYYAFILFFVVILFCLNNPFTIHHHQFLPENTRWDFCKYLRLEVPVKYLWCHFCYEWHMQVS